MHCHLVQGVVVAGAGSVVNGVAGCAGSIVPVAAGGFVVPLAAGASTFGVTSVVAGGTGAAAGGTTSV